VLGAAWKSPRLVHDECRQIAACCTTSLAANGADEQVTREIVAQADLRIRKSVYRQGKTLFSGTWPVQDLLRPSNP
jgi:hypothetical protein